MDKKTRRSSVSPAADGVCSDMTNKKMPRIFEIQAPSSPYTGMEPLNLYALLMKTLDIMVELGDDERLYDHLSDEEIAAVRKYFLPALRGQGGPSCR